MERNRGRQKNHLYPKRAAVIAPYRFRSEKKYSGEEDNEKTRERPRRKLACELRKLTITQHYARHTKIQKNHRAEQKRQSNDMDAFNRRKHPFRFVDGLTYPGIVDPLKEWIYRF